MGKELELATRLEREAYENKSTKKQAIADKLSLALRSYNAIVPPSQWRGYEEIDAVSSALTYGDGQIDLALQRLMNAAETVQGENRFTVEVRRLLKQAHALFYHHYFSYYCMNIIITVTPSKPSPRDALRRGAISIADNVSFSQREVFCGTNLCWKYALQNRTLSKEYITEKTLSWLLALRDQGESCTKQQIHSDCLNECRTNATIGEKPFRFRQFHCRNIFD